MSKSRFIQLLCIWHDFQKFDTQLSIYLCHFISSVVLFFFAWTSFWSTLRLEDFFSASAVFIVLVCFVYIASESQGSKSSTKSKQRIIISSYHFSLLIGFLCWRTIEIYQFQLWNKNILHSCIFFLLFHVSGCFTSKQINKQFESYRECILYNLGVYKNFIYCCKWLDSYLCAMGTEFLP